MSILDNSQFVFIIGAPRSGTTWLHKMVAEHRECFSLKGSNTFLHKYIFNMLDMYNLEKEILTDNGFDRGLPSKISKEEFDGLLTDYISRFYEILPEGYNCYVEKATDNTSEVARIKRFIPNAKFIHIVRDGRNVTLSQIKLRKKHGFPFGIENIFVGANQWKEQVEEVRRNSTEFSNDVLEVKYEDLFDNTYEELLKVFRFIGLEIDEPEITRISDKYYFKNNAVSSPTSAIVGENGSRSNTYEKEMSYWDLALFEYIAGDTLQKYGYLENSVIKKRFVWGAVRFLRIPCLIISHKLRTLRKKLKS